jgi:glycosyltransferase involved in cell wall biosynthesis
MAYTEFKEFYYKVAFRGPILTQSGYGEYCRSLYKIVRQYDEFDITLQPTNWGVTPFIMDKNHEDWEALTKGMERSGIELQQKIKYDVSFQVQLPDEWDVNVADFNIGVTAATEVDRVSEAWQHACNKMDLVIAMSEHTKRSLLNGPVEIKTPIVVLGAALKPETVDESVECPIEFPEEVEDVFLHVGQISGDVVRDRKNTYALIAAFREAYKDDPTKALMVKVNLGRNTAIDRNNSFITLHNFVKSQNLESKAKVFLLHGPMTTKQVGSLYRHPKIKAFVSFTRGEGFGLPFMEAAANGLPIVATNHSSYTEFLRKNGEPKFVRVDYIMNEVPTQYVDGRIIPPGSKWADVPYKECVDAFKRLEKKGLSTPRSWAKELAPVVSEKFNIHNLVNQFADNLCEVAPDLFLPDEEEE